MQAEYVDCNKVEQYEKFLIIEKKIRTPIITVKFYDLEKLLQVEHYHMQMVFILFQKGGKMIKTWQMKRLKNVIVKQL